MIGASLIIYICLYLSTASIEAPRLELHYFNEPLKEVKRNLNYLECDYVYSIVDGDGVYK